jgi:hypothetical protein
MRLAALVLTLAIAAPAVAKETAPLSPQKREVMHYRTLEKMLRRFATQAGDASRGKIFASR